MRFKDKVIIITGSSDGIGKETALMFAREGGLVVLHGRNQSKLQSVANAIKQIGNKLLIVKGDLLESKMSEHIVETTLTHLGILEDEPDVDIWIPNRSTVFIDSSPW